MTFRARVTRRATVQSDDFEEFVFGSEPLQVGDLERQRLAALISRPPEPLELYQGVVTLGPNGTTSVTIDKIPEKSEPFELESELEYKDPSGEIQTVAKTQTIWPAKVLVGIKAADWNVTGRQLNLQLGAINSDGKPVANLDVKVRLFRRQDLSHRKRLVGGFYAYDNVSRITLLKDNFCAGKTSAKGVFTCRGKSPATGDLLAEVYATVDGKQVTAVTDVYVSGGDATFSQEAGDRIDLIADKKLYEPGETARIQVRMPFQKAFALAVVEREGIQNVKVKKLSGKDPSVNVEIKDEYAPNTYVSVMVVRGRSAKPAADFLVDLAKPAFKLGIIPVKVARRAYTLDVKVDTPKKTYQARDEVEAEVAVTPVVGSLGGDAEAAVAVVDEGLLQLKPNTSWNLLDAMVGERTDMVQTFTSVLQVIGKRHFGLKAQAPGGGGGVEATRSLFDAIVFWQPRLPLDDHGKAKVKFKLNDSLTSFKIVAIAQAGVEKFGTGSTSIATTKDVILLAGVPPTARGGDRLKASFTLRNTTKTPKNLVVKLNLKGVEGVQSDHKPKVLKLKGDSAQEVSWQVAVPEAFGELEYTASVDDGDDGKLADRLVVRQKVRPAVPLRTNQATLVQLVRATNIDLKEPVSAEAGRSRVVVSLSSSLAGDFFGLREYMARYPYSCFEQRLSKAIATGDDKAWNEALAALPGYQDRDGLLKYYPTSREGSPVLTAYVLMLASASGKDLDDNVKASLFEALKGFLNGSLQRGTMSFVADLVMQKLQVLDALSRYGEAYESDLDTFDHDASLWPTSSLIDWIGILKRLPESSEIKKNLAVATKLLKSRMTYRGTTFGFSTDDHDSLWWLMVSPDVNAVRVMLLGLEFPLFGDDLPKMMRSTLARQGKSGHWDLTNANALGVLALKKFAARFEKDGVQGVTKVVLGKETKALDWGQNAQGGRLELAWGRGDAKLEVTQKGGGEPWAQIESRVAIPLKEPVQSGFSLVKEITAMRAKEAGKWHVGDIVKVKLKVEAQADAGYVVIDDPIPTGSSILGTGLGGNVEDSVAGGSNDDWQWDKTRPAYRENTFEGVKVYYDVVPKGELIFEYSFRLNNAGTFRLPPTHVEALYAPDTFGDTPGNTWQVLD